MTSRPEPVTSKFRRYYQNDMIPVYQYSNFPHSNSSSDGSTASLTSILHQKSQHDVNNTQKYDSLDELSINYDDLIFSNLPEESLRRLNFGENYSSITKPILKSKKRDGIFREIIDSYNPERLKSHHDGKKYRPQEKSCKRIIARKPDYPGSRITTVNYQEILNCKNQSKGTLKSPSGNYRITKMKIKKDNGDNIQDIGSKQMNRKLSSNMKKTDTDGTINDSERMTSIKNTSEKSDKNYSTDDFIPVSDEPEHTTKTYEGNSVNENEFSSVEDMNSLTTDQASTDTNNIDKANKPQRILSSWEDWYLKKEKQERKLMAKERLKLKNEEEKKKEQEIAKEKRREMSQIKINEWLKKKEGERLKTQLKEKEKKNDEEVLEQKKNETLEKSSEKYTEWKLKKLELKKQLEQKEKEKLQKEEAEKMIQQTKAQNAFKQWFEKHRDHQLPVPYSYGISDGKLTSYYDKTSNPPPTYFNPKAWTPIIEIKQ